MNNIAYPEPEPWIAQDPRVYLMYTARARELQAEAFGRALGAAGRFVARSATNALHRMADAIRRRRTTTALSRLDDHLLADIGIDREQIPAIAQGLIAPSGDAPRHIVPAAPCPPEFRGEAANDTKPTSVAA